MSDGHSQPDFRTETAHCLKPAGNGNLISIGKKYQMTCVAEKITPELWEKIKTDLGPQYRLHIERRGLDDDFIERDRIVHVETGNYMCPAPVMMRDKSSRWFFYVMSEHAICFRVDDPSRTMLEFYHRNESFENNEYFAFQEQVTEISVLRVLGFLCRRGGCLLLSFRH